ncbi:MAG: dihydrodipicolinate synthase family protein, partial [Hyphococcus sp.]
TSNVAPALCAEMQTATLEGDFERARALQDKLAPLHEALFTDASPAPAKYALSLMGLCAPDVRLPLVEPHDTCKAKVRAALNELGLID